MFQKPISRAKTLGRPTLPIDASVLRSLREDAGLSQLKLARRVYELAGKAWVSDAVKKTSAYRWEKSGTMPPDMAHHLAKVLNTTVAVLQGGMPDAAPSRIDEFQALLKQRLANGEIAEVNSAFENFKDCDDPVRSFAAALSRALELAQLTQADEEFRRLAVLTGLSARDLRRPTRFSGIWFFIASGPRTPTRHEILVDISDVRSAVQTELDAFARRVHESDARVSFHEDGSWFRVNLYPGQRSQLTRTLTFVRCQATEKGLEWVSPTELDRYWLKKLPELAWTKFNFVTGFDSVQAPSSYKNLRVALERYPTREEETLGAEPMLVQIFEGILPEQPDCVFEYTQVGEQQHAMALNYLTVDLWEVFLPYLSDWPLECWSLQEATASILVKLELRPRHFAGRAELPTTGYQFRILLVDIARGAPRAAPWQDTSVSEIHKRLCQELQSALAVQAEKSTPV